MDELAAAQDRQILLAALLELRDGVL